MAVNGTGAQLLRAIVVAFQDESTTQAERGLSKECPVIAIPKIDHPAGTAEALTFVFRKEDVEMSLVTSF